jgi:hypothetical protein
VVLLQPEPAVSVLDRREDLDVRAALAAQNLKRSPAVLHFTRLPSASPGDASKASALLGSWLGLYSTQLAVAMMVQVLEFLSAYFPDYLCSSCLALLIQEPESQVRAALAPTNGLEFATAVCLNCNVSKGTVRFKKR